MNNVTCVRNSYNGIAQDLELGEANPRGFRDNKSHSIPMMLLNQSGVYIIVIIYVAHLGCLV